jgi:hypothetical protein
MRRHEFVNSIDRMGSGQSAHRSDEMSRNVKYAVETRLRVKHGSHLATATRRLCARQQADPERRRARSLRVARRSASGRLTKVEIEGFSGLLEHRERTTVRRVVGR